MKMSQVNLNFMVIVFLLCILYGIVTSIQDGVHTAFLYLSWASFGALIILFISSKVYTNKIGGYQMVALLSILSLYFLSWFLMPHISKFGIFLPAMLCFLYSGVILYNSKIWSAGAIFILAFLFSSINLFVIFYYLGERTIVSRDLINVVFISNPVETKEYLISKVNVYHVLTLLVFGGLAAMILLRKINASRPAPTINVKILVLFAISFSLSSIYGPIGSVTMEYVYYLQQKNEFKALVQLKASGESTPFDITTNEGAEKIVIIIGESLNRDYMSLYGYEKDTTPNLIKLSLDSLDGRLVSFEDMVSPEVTTVEALQKVLTTVNNDNGLSFFNSVTIVDLFNKAGYESFWLSNDYPLGEWNTSTSVIANSADSVYFTMSKKSLKKHDIVFETYHDGELIDVFNHIISNSSPHKKQIFFLHLQGSHQLYKDRYPVEFDVFSSQNKEENYYLNSVLYNDWVVNEFITVAKQNKVDVVAYFSDHGEDIGRGHNPESFTKGMCHIPFMFYLSNRYIQLNPELYTNLLKSKTKAGITDNFIHDIQELTGVKASFFDPSLSFITDAYIPKRRYIVNNKILYE